MWDWEILYTADAVTKFLNKNNIKPNNCKITEYSPHRGDTSYTLFYYKEN